MENKKYNLLSLSRYLKSYKKSIFVVFITLIITSASVLLLGKIIKHFIDLGFSAENSGSLIKISIISLFIIICLAIAGYFRSFLINSVAQKVIFTIRKQIYSHIINISPDFFENNKVGDIISRMTNDVNLLYNIISNVISFFIRNVIVFLGALIFLFTIDYELTLVIFLLIIISLLPILFLIKKIKIFADIEAKDLSICTSHIEETTNFLKVIQSSLGQNKEIDNFNQKMEKTLHSSIKRIKIRSLLISLIIVFAFGTIILILSLGSLKVISGKMTPGELSSFIFYAMLVATSAAGISRVLGQLSIASIACNRLFEILDLKSTIIDSKNPIKLKKTKKTNIKFDNVSFYYPKNPDKLILNNFNLEINHGQKIAIIGKSGIGKSSIFEILLRFYNISDGKITINGEGIKEISLLDLRSLFSYIPQDPVIFSGTIWDNISYGSDNVSKKDAERFLKNESFNFINNFTDGLDHFVGEKGVMLSGGERQRISIIRALLKDAPILLMDEFTSALDKKNDQLICDLLKKVAKDKIIISITHKKVNESEYDKIIKL
ncbi:MAG: ATP-binding cassette subfamily B protein [Rickettsiales bacterium]|jgi:ATP-binding cassette subfamily B protein